MRDRTVVCSTVNSSRPRVLLAIVFAATVSRAGMLQASGLNDTGQTRCYDIAGTAIPCAAAPAGDDGRYGRDAAAAAGRLSKTGGGAAGFDFTKIANNGSEIPSGASLGGRSNDWACTRDNVTGLTWEVKTTGPTDLRYSGHRYWWYDTNDLENGGNRGSVGNGSTGPNRRSPRGRVPRGVLRRTSSSQRRAPTSSIVATAPSPICLRA